MFWFLNKIYQNTMFDFYQIFIENNKVYSDDESNVIYSFVSNNLNSNKLNFDLSKYKYNNINCKIKIIDHIISYELIDENLNYVFTTKINYICPQNNQFGLPIFLHTYKSVSTKRLPNLIETKYTNIYELNFQIYDIDEINKEIQFVIETNPLTNIKRNYFIVSNLDCIHKYIIDE